MIIWSGQGWLVIPITMLCGALAQGVAKVLEVRGLLEPGSPWPTSLGLLLAGPLVGELARLLDLEPDRRDTLYFIPLRTWAWILPFIALVHHAVNTL